MTANNVRVEGWKDLVDLLGIVRSNDSTESIPSVVLKTTASNAVQVEVKVYDPDADKAKEAAIRIFDEVRGRYGLA